MSLPFKLTEKNIEKVFLLTAKLLLTYPRHNSFRLNSVDLRKQFGHSELNLWVFKHVFHATSDSYKVGSWSKEYIVNPGGIENMFHQLGLSRSDWNPTLNVFKAQIKPQLVQQQKRNLSESEIEQLQSGRFIYTEKSSRLYHSFQSIKSEVRSDLLAEYGYKYDYDVEAAAQTLIYQLAESLGFEPETNNGIALYTADRKLVRKTLADFLSNHPDWPAYCEERSRSLKPIDQYDTLGFIKTLITAVMAGGRLYNQIAYEKIAVGGDLVDVIYREPSSSYKLAGPDRRIYTALKNHPWFRELDKDIKQIWRTISNKHELIHENRVIERVSYTNKKTKKEVSFDRKKQLNSAEKWSIYFNLERYVITEQAQSYCDRNSIRTFLIHDGFMTDRMIRVSDFEQYVYAQTGFRIKLEGESYGHGKPVYRKKYTVPISALHTKYNQVKLVHEFVPEFKIKELTESGLDVYKLTYEQFRDLSSQNYLSQIVSRSKLVRSASSASGRSDDLPVTLFYSYIKYSAPEGTPSVNRLRFSAVQSQPPRRFAPGEPQIVDRIFQTVRIEPIEHRSNYPPTG